MSFNVLGQMRLGMLVGSGDSQQPFPLNPSLLDEITLIQNNMLKVPVITITLHDTFAVQEELRVFGDGSPFSIEIGWEQAEEPYRSHPFRVFTLPKQISTEFGSRIQIQGYLDIPLYFRKRVEEVWNGPSSQVLTEIAEQSSIIHEITGTDDAQVWLPDGRSYADYARFVANHGWANSESCMDLAITQIPDTLSQRETNDIPWMLRYLDLTRQIEGPASAIFFNDPGGEIGDLPAFSIVDIDIKNHSGFFNHWLGYGNRMGQEALTGEYHEHDQVHIIRSMHQLELNKELRSQLGIVRREVAPIDCGNTHPNYIAAYYQNRRTKAIYPVTAEVLLLERTGIRLLDKIQLQLAVQQTDRVNETYHGDYLVTAKSIAIAGGYYREKFELVGQGNNNTVNFEGF